jgi:hypothetical protein
MYLVTSCPVPEKHTIKFTFLRKSIIPFIPGIVTFTKIEHRIVATRGGEKGMRSRV